MIVIRLEGVPETLFVESYDPNAKGGRGHVKFTPYLTKAIKFDTMSAAFEFWRQPSAVMPLRPDGEPNRPLTAYTVTLEGVIPRGY